MKTFEEIKQALTGCKPGRCVPDCPYGDMIGCVQTMHRDTLAMIQQLEAQVPKWICVEERLPGSDDDVLIMTPAGISIGYCNIYVGYWGDYINDEGDHITHWMPLPELPKEAGHAQIN